MASTLMTPETGELYDRITALFATRDITPPDRTRIRDAFDMAATWESIPDDVRDLIEEYEAQEPVEEFDELDDIEPDEPGRPVVTDAGRRIQIPIDEAYPPDEGDATARSRSLKLAELRSRDLLDEIDLDVVEEVRTRGLDDETRAVGNQFKQYWLYGKGRARWNTWTELYHGLLKEAPHLGPARAKRIAAQWFHSRYGFWPGDDRNRVKHGKPPRGKRIGPG